MRRGLLAAVLCLLRIVAAAQSLPAPEDTRHSMLREAMLGLLPRQPDMLETDAQQHCLDLPVAAPDDRVLGPHGDKLLTTRCQVAGYDLIGGPAAGWAIVRYVWRSVFTAEDKARGPAARDTINEEEVVLVERTRPGRVRPVWHARFETGSHANWRSVTPEVASTTAGATLLSVMSCLNGTGGCGQEFLLRGRDDGWRPVWQVWLDQLPAGFAGRIRHGVRIDPHTLKAEAGFYAERDANCCPSQLLSAQLALHGDRLVLVGYSLVPEPER